VKVAIKEDLLDTDKDKNSPKVALASITCIKQTREEDESKVLVQEEEVKPPIVCYTPRHMRRKDTII
jgi:hypothetical protein